MAEEVVLARANAILDGLYNRGVLELTSRRLVWRAHRIRLPLTAILGERELSIPLDEIEACRVVGVPFYTGLELLVASRVRTHLFKLSRWWIPSFLLWNLPRRWAARINEAKLEVENEAELSTEEDAPT